MYCFCKLVNSCSRFQTLGEMNWHTRMLQQLRRVTRLLLTNVNSRSAGLFIPLPFEMPRRYSNWFNLWPIGLLRALQRDLKSTPSA